MVPAMVVGIDDVIDTVVLGVGLEMGQEPWRLVGGGDSSVQPLVVWSFASPQGVH